MSFDRFILSEQALKDILKTAGIVISYDTQRDWIGYCCFHHNTDSPAFNMSKDPPYLFRCQNAKCAVRGNIFTLLTQRGYSKSEAKKILLLQQGEINDLAELVLRIMEEPEDVNEWLEEDPSRFQREDSSNNWIARSYLYERGVSRDAYEFFHMGYSQRKAMAIIPIFDHHSRLVGLIGRSIEGKRYQYSDGTPRSTVIWNLNNCKDNSEIVLTEGALDSVALWDAGIKNCGAVLGSAISKGQWHHLKTYFDSIVCFFDNDAAGNALRDQIIQEPHGLLIYTVQYPEGDSKDPGMLTKQQIQKMYAERTLTLPV